MATILQSNLPIREDLLRLPDLTRECGENGALQEYGWRVASDQWSLSARYFPLIPSADATAAIARWGWQTWRGRRSLELPPDHVDLVGRPAVVGDRRGQNRRHVVGRDLAGQLLHGGDPGRGFFVVFCRMDVDQAVLLRADGENPPHFQPAGFGQLAGARLEVELAEHVLPPPAVGHLNGKRRADRRPIGTDERIGPALAAFDVAGDAIERIAEDVGRDLRGRCPRRLEPIQRP